MKAMLGALVIAGAFCRSVAAQDIDGISEDLRDSFYNAQTAMVATVRTPRAGTQAIMQAFLGMFDAEPLAVARKAVKDFDGSIRKMFGGYTALADGLALANYGNMTVVGFSGAGVFSALDMGPDVEDFAFDAAKSALETVFQTNGFEVSLTRRENYVLIHLPNAGLPAAERSAEVERAVTTGLMQSTAAAAVSFASPTSNETVRAYLTSPQYGTAELGKALVEADYLGGYLVSGGRPELHLYARFVSKDRADAVKAVYERIWAEQIAKAIEQDKATEKANEEAKVKGGIIFNYYINLETLYRRIAAASEATVFNNTFQLALDTADLRQITGAAVDRFYRPAP